MEVDTSAIFYLSSAALPVLLFATMLLYATAIFIMAIPVLKVLLGVVSLAFGVTGFIEVFVNGKRGW
ncbi:MAG: hypothetical protein KGH78_04575 [Candidatus Micrarchaeota archaeon]|nr:hypothetical protein [Candidatus Micrarchaeota archaeon]